MKYFLKSCIAKILFILLIVNPEIRPVIIAAAPITVEALATITTIGVAAVTFAFTQYQTNKNKPVSINIGDERIPTQIVETRGKTEDEVVDEIMQIVSQRLGEIHRLSNADQKKLDAELRLSKQQVFNDSLLDSTSRSSAQHRYNTIHNTVIRDLRRDNRQKAVEADQKCEQDKFEYARAYHSVNRKNTYNKLDGVVTVFSNFNHPDLKKRIEARMQLWYLANLKPHIFGYEIGKAAKSLLSRYFYCNKLVDISYDKRLAETMEFFLSKGPYHRWRDQGFKKLFDLVKEEKLDCGDSFARLERKINNQLSKEDKKRKGEYKFKIYRFRGNKSEEIVKDQENFKLLDVATFCKQGNFIDAFAIANGFTADRPRLISVINYYQQELCNEFGILKKYEYLPSWQNLPVAEKKKLTSSIYLQTSMNKELQAEEVRLQAEIALQEETELKVASELEREAALKAEADSTQKEKQKSLVPADAQNIEQPISTPAPPSPKQDDPEKGKEKEQSSDSTKTHRDSLKNNNLKSHTIKEGLKERFNLTKKIKEHIFSKDHVDKGIFNLGNNEVDIVNKFINIILLADHKDLLKEGSNQIHTIINGQKVVIRFFIKEGEILMLNGFIETNANKIGNVFRLLIEEYL